MGAENELETPSAVAELEGSVRRDLLRIKAAVVGGVGLLAGLEDALRLLPDSRGQCRSWRLMLEEMARQVDEEADAVTKKLRGDTNPIEQRIDEEHAANVISLRTGS